MVVDEVHAERGLLVAFSDLVRPFFAHADVEIGDIARFAVHVLIQIERGFAGIHHDGVVLLRIQLPQVLRHGDRLLLLHALQAGIGFLAQILHAVARRIGRIAEIADLLGTRQQQIALDQLRQFEIGIEFEQRVDFVQRHVEAIVADRLQTSGQRLFHLARSRLR